MKLNNLGDPGEKAFGQPIPKIVKNGHGAQILCVLFIIDF